MGSGRSCPLPGRAIIAADRQQRSREQGELMPGDCSGPLRKEKRMVISAPGALFRPSRLKSICLNQATRFTIQASKSGTWRRYSASDVRFPPLNHRFRLPCAESGPPHSVAGDQFAVVDDAQASFPSQKCNNVERLLHFCELGRILHWHLRGPLRTSGRDRDAYVVAIERTKPPPAPGRGCATTEAIFHSYRASETVPFHSRRNRAGKNAQ